MALPSYEDRKIDAVLIKDLDISRGARTLAVGNIIIVLARSDGSPDGPGVQIEAAVEVSPNQGFEDVERALLDRGLALLRRITELNANQLHEILVQSQKKFASDS